MKSLRLPRVLHKGCSFQPSQDGFSGSLRLQRSPGNSLGGTHSGTGLASQHIAVAGGLGIAGGHPRGGIRGSAACAQMGLHERLRLRRRRTFAAIVRGKAPGYFLLPQR
jgi:hypothetical protein